MHFQRVARPKSSVNDSFFSKRSSSSWGRNSLLNMSVGLLRVWKMSRHCRSSIILLVLNRLCHLLLLHILKLPVKFIFLISKSYYWRHLKKIGSLFLVFRLPSKLHVRNETVHSFLHQRQRSHLIHTRIIQLLYLGLLDFWFDLFSLIQE